MNVRKLINKRFRRRANGVDVQGDVNAVVAANVNEPGGSTFVSSKQVSRERREQRERQTGDSDQSN